MELHRRSCGLHLQCEIVGDSGVEGTLDAVAGTFFDNYRDRVRRFPCLVPRQTAAALAAVALPENECGCGR